MKMPTKKTKKKLLYIFVGFVLFLIIIDYIALPLYVSGREMKVPNVIGKQKDEAIKILDDAGFNPIVATSRYDQKYKKDYVVFQKPVPNTVVKEHRRIYLTISGGESLIKMPQLIGKTLRDAQVTLERSGFILGKIDSVESEFQPNTIVEQQYLEGRELASGTNVNIKVSIGPQVGMIRVPNILGKSLTDAMNILRANSLRVGAKTYIHSPSLLPNTVVDQQPGENALLKLGDSVNVVLTQSKISDIK